MKRIKKFVAAMLLGTAMLTSTVPVLADSGSPEIVPFAELGACPACGYSSAVVIDKYCGDWSYNVGSVWHNDHYDYYNTRALYIVTQCPECGQRITSSVTQKLQICPEEI